MDTPVGIASRREFLSAAAALAAAAALPSAVRSAYAQPRNGLEACLAAEPERPQFHLLPAAGWMNDPNGPIYWRGRYHMFFQYNPHGPEWGDISWDHAVSPDMMHWEHLPVALAPTPGGPDAAGCFTGSAIAVGPRVYVVYTGVVESGPEQATIRDGQNHLKESQCLAWSDDADLVHWQKRPQPIIPAPPAGMKINGFRDPSAWKHGDSYYMTVGCGIAEVGGCVLLYRSPDLEQWSYLHTLEQGTWSGRPAANPVASGEMWECPEFFPLDGGHVLIYSTEGKVYWQSGRLDMQTLRFTPAKTGQLDVGDYYAPKTQLDAEGRRVLWGWIPETRPKAAYMAAGWAGMMSLPRVLRLAPDGQLHMETLPALASLRGEALQPSRSGDAVTIDLPSANGEFLVTAPTGGTFACMVTNAVSREEILHVTSASAQDALIANGTHVMTGPEGVHLHGFVDGSVVSLIVNGRAGFTRRFYYPQTTAPTIQVRLTGSGTQTEAWKVHPISDNRLTTPATL